MVTTVMACTCTHIEVVLLMGKQRLAICTMKNLEIEALQGFLSSFEEILG